MRTKEEILQYVDDLLCGDNFSRETDSECFHDVFSYDKTESAILRLTNWLLERNDIEASELPSNKPKENRNSGGGTVQGINGIFHYAVCPSSSTDTQLTPNK